jgi:hypothetical protein
MTEAASRAPEGLLGGRQQVVVFVTGDCVSALGNVGRHPESLEPLHDQTGGYRRETGPESLDLPSVERGG